MITYHEVIPLLFEAFPDIHREYLEDAERNGPGALDDDQGRPMPYCILPSLMWQVRDAVKSDPSADLARMALAFVEKIARDGDEDARELIYIEVAEVFAENLPVRRLMGPATQFMTMHYATLSSHPHVPREGWPRYRDDTDLNTNIDDWLRLTSEAAVADADARLRSIADVPPTIAGPESWWGWTGSDLAPEDGWPRLLASWQTAAEADLAAGNHVRAKARAADIYEGVLEWERCKAWGLV